LLREVRGASEVDADELLQSKFKRLKRGHRDEEPREKGLEEIFSDEEEAEDEGPRYTNRHQVDEFEDFIENDYPEDEEDRIRQEEDEEVAVRGKAFAGGVVDTAGLDKDALEEMEAIFGNGDDYGWALDLEDEEEERDREEQAIELKDVFEPSQLVEKMLTDEDNEIRAKDEPERFQLDRKPFKNLQITTEQFKEEARWITNLIWPKKGFATDLHGPFTRAVGKLLEFFVVDGFEVPFVFHHKRDYVFHSEKIRNEDRDPDAPEFIYRPKPLLNMEDMWRILELDIKFRSMIEKRNGLEKTYDNLSTVAGIKDTVIESMLPQAENMEELQDLQDYVNFQYAVQLADMASMNGNAKGVKRPGAKSSQFERVRKSKAYGFVKAYGITPDRLAQNALREGKKASADDDPRLPMELADSLTDGDFMTGDSVINAARQMYSEELFHNPRMRKHFRLTYYMMGVVSCKRTEKGLRRIDESHPFWEIKYLINQTLADMARRPEIFLKMMKAEEEGLVEVKLNFQNEREFRRQLYAEFASDNFSELADAWNDERQKVLDLAFTKLEKVIVKGVKESLRTACQDEVLNLCREEYNSRLDQAPYKPKGMVAGTTPRVLALSNGGGDPGRDGVTWAWVEDDGRIVEHGKFVNLSRDEAQREALVELVRRRVPDVIGVSGWSADSHKVVRDVESIVSERNLLGAEYTDPKTGGYRSDLLEVIVVNDEVARLYKDSPRAQADHPTLAPLTRYCVALAKYVQNPLKEYAALGKDVTSLAFHPVQKLLPPERLARYLETAMVDIVNLCGVDINEAVNDPYTANLLPYLSGLGPRKASAVIKGINANGGSINSRDELVGDPDSGKLPVVGPIVWNNCASFIIIEFDATNPQSDPLDSTRVHPQDYELGRKMAADALELDEEDVKAETDDNGPSAIVRKLFKDDEQDRVNELILEEYAEQLERNYQQRKRAVLEIIRAELMGPYDELRKTFNTMNSDDIFTMFTGENRDTLHEGMIVPVNVRVVKDDFAIVKLDCGIEGRVEAHEVSYRDPIKSLLHVGMTTQAKLLELSRREFTSKLSLREDQVRRPYRKPNDHTPSTWDFRQEDEDREALREKDKTTGRTQRVINHPLFRPFNSTQAEEYLGSQSAGECVIRPSSKGNDHLAVTWKVADGVYQHIDVLELQKDNEFSLGRTLRVGGKYTYSDLDELINDHVKAMARKVDELMQSEKYHAMSRADLGKLWPSPRES
jgi:transcription elongation factor SPT6